jgi:hypothetical protein
MMPSLVNFDIKVNLPPSGCSISILSEDSLTTITEIIGIQTRVILRVDGCIDEDLPLSYRFAYFYNESQYKNDIINS